MGKKRNIDAFAEQVCVTTYLSGGDCWAGGTFIIASLGLSYSAQDRTAICTYACERWTMTSTYGRKKGK